MNLLLLNENDFIANNRVRLSDRRLKHLLNIQKVIVGDSLKAGLLNHKIGLATVTQINELSIELETQFDKEAPEPLPLTLILALPRPKMLRRIFQTIATLGIKECYLVNSYRVEKSYWQSPWLEQQAIEEQLTLGLEQGVDTLMPNVYLRKRFKPFVEDELPDIVGSTTGLVAHPIEASPCPVSLNSPATLAIGPEGGFIGYEIDKLNEAGLQTVSLGQRIMRVETAVTASISRLFTG